MSYFFKYLHSVQNITVLHNQLRISLLMYSFSFPFPASSLPFIVQPREELNCCTVLVNAAHWIWQCLHMGAAPWVSVGLVTSINVVGSHLEGLTQHQ